MNIEKRIYINTFYSGDGFEKPVHEILTNTRDLTKIDIPDYIDVFQFFERNEVSINNEVYKGEERNHSKRYILANNVYKTSELKNSGLLENKSIETMLRNRMEILAETRDGRFLNVRDNEIVVNLSNDILYPK